MAVCPHCGNEADFGNRSISYCKGGCGKTLFLCRCGSANSPLASYCRHCGREISFHDTERLFNRDLKVTSSSLDQPLLELPLSQFGISRADGLPQLYFSFGLMLLLSRSGRIFILNCHNGDVLERIDLSGGHIVGRPLEICTKIDSKGEKAWLISTAKGIYKFDLIREHVSEQFLLSVGQASCLPAHMLACPDEGQGSLCHQDFTEISHQPVYLDGYLLLSLWNAQQVTTQIKLVSPDGSRKDILSVEGRISQPIRAEDRVFFYSKDKILVYDHTKQGILYEGKNRHGFDIDSDPKCAPPHVYVLNDKKDRIYRINLDSDEPEVFGLPHPDVIQINFEVADGQILISHSKGVLVTDILGSVEWSSEAFLNPFPAFKFPPECFGNYIAFVMTRPPAEALYIIERPGYKQSALRLGNFVLKPAFYLGQLYTVVEEDGVLKMKMYPLY